MNDNILVSQTLYFFSILLIVNISDKFDKLYSNKRAWIQYPVLHVPG